MQVSPPQFSYLRGLLKKKTGVVIDESKQYLVVARLLPIVRQRKLASLDTLIDRIRTAAGSPLENDVMNAMMTHETSFFRDRTPFETLKSIIPDFLKSNFVYDSKCIKILKTCKHIMSCRCTRTRHKPAMMKNA